MLITPPNVLTGARVLAVPAMVAAFYLPGALGKWVTCAIFTVAAVTDYFDGYLARSWSMQSPFGRMLDPIADKLLVSATLLMLAADETIAGLNLVAAIIILCREILVSGLREFLAELRVPVPVTRLAKWKTSIQLVAIGFLIAGSAGDRIFAWTTAIGLSGLWIAAGFTVVTGYDYFRVGVAHLMDENK
jgi:cardiolipin synthase (CMP-forming)